ncbi:MAG: hypothetical protein HUK12_10655, partial [Muribaculaceae bacterium]|nr:hypothetical protein [Muribaculaceae bacterium]
RFKPEVVKEQKVIIGKDTVSNLIHEKNYGRYDRGLFNYLYLPKGQWLVGLTASYGSLDSEDLSFLSYIGDFDFGGSMFSINPSVAYVVRHNNVIGLRIGYSRNRFNLDNINVDFAEDLNFSLKDVKYHTNKYSAEIFYRHYLGLDNSRRFAIFNEVGFVLSGGNGNFVRNYNGLPKDTYTETLEMRLNFSPGVNFFLQEKVSISLSFGVFGWYFTRNKQTTNGESPGSQISSGANFKFNVFNINFGMTFHI